MTTLTSARPLAAPRWIARTVRALPVLFLIMDAGIKVLALPPAVTATVELGYPAHVVVGLGIVLLVCLALYLLPRTAVLGAILLTGYLGGAIATHVRVDGSIGSLLFPLVLGALLWGGLVLEDPRLRALLWRDPAGR